MQEWSCRLWTGRRATIGNNNKRNRVIEPCRHACDSQHTKRRTRHCLATNSLRGAISRVDANALDEVTHAVVSFWRVRESDAPEKRNDSVRIRNAVSSPWSVRPTVIIVTERTSVLDTVDSHTGQVNRYFVRRKCRRCIVIDRVSEGIFTLST